MAGFSNTLQAPRSTRATSPIKAVGRTTTHEGGAAYKRDAKSELFMLAVTFLNEATFYESKDARADRLRSLVHTVTKQDFQWMLRFIPWLRNVANMRTASIVIAIEYARAGGPSARSAVASAMSRADEPGEAIAYIKSRGYPLSGGVQRGIADAAGRLYDEYSAIKYGGAARNYHPADVLNLAHVKPNSSGQSELFKFLLDKRHHNDAKPSEGLPMLTARAQVDAIPVKERSKFLRSASAAEKLRAAGYTWEALSGWLQGPMDAAAWEAIIPTMGYMALLRNLRNFDEAGVSLAVRKTVAARLADPAQVAKSRQFPYRFYSAYNEVANDVWRQPLNEALDLSTQNIPAFEGSTLLLVDTSGSMTTFGWSAKSKVTPVVSAALFGVAMAKKGNAVDLYGFADGTFRHNLQPGSSVLPEVQRFVGRVGEAGHGTQIDASVRKTLRAEHKRVVIISDMQTFSSYHGRTVSQLVPAQVPVYAFNLGGYDSTVVDAGGDNRHEFGGLNDATFKMLSLIEVGKSADWPF